MAVTVLLFPLEKDTRFQMSNLVEQVQEQKKKNHRQSMCQTKQNNVVQAKTRNKVMLPCLNGT